MIKFPLIEEEKGRYYFGICTCCGCYYGIEFFESSNHIIYRCFDDRKISDSCLSFNQDLDLDQDGRCQIENCLLRKNEDIQQSLLFEINFITDLIKRYNIFFLSTANLSFVLRKIIEKVQVENKYFIYHYKKDIFDTFVFKLKENNE